MTTHGRAREVLDGVVTTEAQLVATLLVVFGALAVAAVLVPWVLVRGGRWVRDDLDDIEATAHDEPGQ